MLRKASAKVWKSVLVECEPGFEDMVASMIFEAGFSGFQEEAANGRTMYTAFFSLQPDTDPLDSLQTALAARRTLIKTLPARIAAVDAVPETDWERKWREGLAAVETGRQLVVRPSWVEYENTGGRIEIIINPKMAFGTGGHATTALCLEAVERLNLGGKTVIDAGCGSGVLSIAAARLGAVRVYGFDNDPFSVDNAEENIRINGVQDRVTVEAADLERVRPVPADMVFANLISGVLIAHLHAFRAFLNPGGTVVFSGLLAVEEKMFASRLAPEGFRLRSVEYRDEWIAITADLV